MKSTKLLRQLVQEKRWQMQDYWQGKYRKLEEGQSEISRQFKELKSRLKQSGY